MGSQGISGEQANWQVATGEGHKRSWVAEYKKECEIIFSIFTSKISWFDGLGGMSVFIFLISPGGDDSYYTIYIQWQMMVITSVKFERKHSSNSFKKGLLKIFPPAVVLKSHSPSWKDQYLVQHVKVLFLNPNKIC